MQEQLRNAPCLEVINVMSADPQWPGEKGKIDRECITRLVPDLLEREVYLCGPPPMMKMVRKTLLDMGLPASQIHW